MRLLRLCLLCLLPGCATAATPAVPASPLLASLRWGGIAIRPESPHPVRPPPPAAPPASRSAPPQRIPAALRRPEELRLLGGRLGAAPSLGIGCAAVFDTAPAAKDGAAALESCLGGSLGGPLEAAAVIEQVAAGRVISVTAEEGFPSAASAEQRFEALKGRLRGALGPPQARAGLLLFRPRDHELSLELLAGSTSYVTLQLRRTGAGPGDAAQGRAAKQ